MFTQQEVAGQWNTLVGAVKEKYGQITDNELNQVNGNIDQLIGLVQRKSGQTREQVEEFIRECGETCDSVAEKVAGFASQAGETLREGYESVARHTKSGYEASVETVSRRPLESVGVALGVGILTGLLIGISVGAQRERNLSWRERLMR